MSPGRGLILYSTILLFSIRGFARAWKLGSPEPAHILLRYSPVGIGLVILVHCKWWRCSGDIRYGPRLRADVLPALCIGLYPVADLILNGRHWTSIAAVLALWSIVAHFQGASWDDGRWTG